MVNVEDIRHALNDMSPDRVSDDVINYNLEKAKARVLKVASSQARAEDIDDAITACAAYASYLSYALEVERAAGGMPPAINSNLQRLYDDCIFWRSSVQGSTATTSPGQIFGQLGLNNSLYDDPGRDPSSRGRTA
jgi:hypothetical protein